MGNTRVDTAAVHAAAQRFTAASDILDGAHGMADLRFHGSTAGRAHAASGERLHAALDRLIGELAEWSRAAAEVGAALRAGAQAYAEADLHAAAALQ